MAVDGDARGAGGVDVVVVVGGDGVVVVVAAVTIADFDLASGDAGGDD